MSCNLIQIVAALAAAGVIAQPTLSQVKALAHFETTTEERGHSLTLNSGAVLAPEAARFGSNGVKFPTNCWVTINLAAGDMPGTNDFTIEFWLRLTAWNTASGIGLQGIYNHYSSDGKGFHITAKTDGSMVVGNGVSAAITAPAGTVALNNWYHVAVTRKGTKLSLWMNGVEIVNGSAASINLLTTLTYLGYGGSNPTYGYMTGHIDEYRFTSGLAVYTETFTPPTQPFTLPAN